MAFDVWILILIPVVAFGAFLVMVGKAKLTEAEAHLMDAERLRDQE